MAFRMNAIFDRDRWAMPTLLARLTFRLIRAIFKIDLLPSASRAKSIFFQGTCQIFR
jgi:hypothetical protein